MTQLDTLKKVVNNRSLAICYHGKSATVLEDRIQEFKPFDICWSGINDFWIMEHFILEQIGEQFDIVICSAKENLVPDKPHIEFLNRKDDNLFVTELVSFYPSQVDKNFAVGIGVNGFIKHHDKKLFLFTADRSPDAMMMPNKEHPTHFLAQASFTILISLGIIGGAKEIFLFGTDGATHVDYTQYPKRTESVNGIKGQGQSERGRLVFDTEIFQNTMLQIVRNVCQTYECIVPPIYHVGEKSYYGVFPTVSYDECLSILKSSIPETKAV